MVKVFYAEVDDFPAPSRAEILRSVRSPARKDYLFSIKSQKALKQSYSLWLLVQKVCEENGIDSSGFFRTEGGNWAIRDSERYFSFSHSESLAAFAFSDHAVGVDAERITERIVKLSGKIKKGENFACDAETLTRLWTEKESEYKRGKVGFFSGRKICDGLGKEYYISVCSEEEYAEFIKTEL